MKYLVYKVKPLPQSLLAMVWNFGSLDTAADLSEEAKLAGIKDTETEYIHKMARKLVRVYLQ